MANGTKKPSQLAREARLAEEARRVDAMEPDPVSLDASVPTRIEVRSSIKALHIRASEFELGGMDKMARFDREVAGQLARLLAEVERAATNVGDINKEIREELSHGS